MDLNKDQNVEYYYRGVNMFLTGRAGTGKTRVLKVIKTEQNIYYTAPTSKAVSNVAGCTVQRNNPQ